MAAKPSTAIKRFGTDIPPADTRLLTAGPLSAELDAGNLRYIRYQGREAIRAISYVVRDQFWGTFNPQIDDFSVSEDAAGFFVTYAATCRDGDTTFSYRAEITGKPDGSLRFAASGTAKGDFLTNRTGFVVLHGTEGICGHPVTVEDIHGNSIDTEFPEQIDPKQPIMDIRALTHQVASGLSVTCRMEGDTFEMEDQRNWTDASYKTYVRPLGLPHPYIIASEETVQQSVSLAFSGAAPVATATTSGADSITIDVGPGSGRMPQIGMALQAGDAATALKYPDQMAALRPRFFSCYLDTREPNIESALQQFKAVADAMETPLALEAVLPEDTSPHASLQNIAELAAAIGVSFDDVAVTTAGDLNFVVPGTVFPDSKAFDDLYSAARSAFPNARIGGGNFVYFTELNRKRPPRDNLDFITHGTSALVHAADDRSVTETIECLPYIFNSVRTLFGDKHYRIAPAGIGSRTSPFGNDPTPNPNAERVTMTSADPRQRGLLGAAWYLGYTARAVAGGVDSLVMGAPVGAFGLIQTPLPYAQPWYEAASPEGGLLYPAYHVLRAMYDLSGNAASAVSISNPRAIQALAVQQGDRLDIWIANLTGDTQSIALTGRDFTNAGFSRLDDESFERCAENPAAFDAAVQVLPPGPLSLSPYATLHIRTA